MGGVEAADCAAADTGADARHRSADADAANKIGELLRGSQVRVSRRLRAPLRARRGAAGGLPLRPALLLVARAVSGYDIGGSTGGVSRRILDDWEPPDFRGLKHPPASHDPRASTFGFLDDRADGGGARSGGGGVMNND